MKLGKAKNNQAKSFFSYKNDDVELVDIGQFLRETTDYRVEREWYILSVSYTHLTLPTIYSV